MPKVQHLMGYLKNELSAEDKQELLGLIEEYRQGMLPLIVPLTLLKRHLCGGMRYRGGCGSRCI